MRVASYLLAAYSVVLISGFMDVAFWFLSQGTYFVPSWVLGAFMFSIAVSSLAYSRSNEAAPGESESMRLSLRQRLVLRINGRVFLGRETRPGWSGSLPFYAFRCGRHGLVKDYFHGFPGEQYLACPDCWNERCKSVAILCDFGDCERAAAVWVCCDGVKRPYCDLHKENHSIHVGPRKYEAEIEGGYARCDAEKSFAPMS